MSISAISSAANVQAELQTPVQKPAVSQSPNVGQPVDKVSLSPAAQKTVSADVDRDGDSH